MPCFNGESVEITGSIECIEDLQVDNVFDSTILLDMGINLIKEEKVNMIQGSKQVRYREKQVRKSNRDSLKKYKR